MQKQDVGVDVEGKRDKPRGPEKGGRKKRERRNQPTDLRSEECQRSLKGREKRRGKYERIHNIYTLTRDG